MNPSNEIIRTNILIQLEAAYPVSLPSETLQQGLQLAGLPTSYPTLVKQLEYLADKGFLSLSRNELYPHLKRYKLSTKGIDFLDNENASQHF